MALVTKRKVHQDPCNKSYVLESPLQRVRSISFRNPADYKKNLPKNRWLIGADGQNSAEDFRSTRTVYIGVNLLFFFIPRCRISCINGTFLPPALEFIRACAIIVVWDLPICDNQILQNIGP